MMNKQYEGNWTEDFSHENGNYMNICKECRNEFFGNKRRVVCKLCFSKPHTMTTEQALEELKLSVLKYITKLESLNRPQSVTGDENK